VVTIRNGVSIAESTNKSPVKHSGEKLVIAYLGGISAHKGHHFLREIIERFKMVDLFKPEGYEKPELCGGSQLSYIGKVSSDKLSTFYEQVNVLIAPSIWPESFGLVRMREAWLRM